MATKLETSKERHRAAGLAAGKIFLLILSVPFGIIFVFLFGYAFFASLWIAGHTGNKLLIDMSYNQPIQYFILRYGALLSGLITLPAFVYARRSRSRVAWIATIFFFFSYIILADFNFVFY